jgi:hypothetical protein
VQDVSDRRRPETDADVIRQLEDRIRDLERGKGLSGVVGVGGLRIGGHVLEQGPSGELRSRRLSDNATFTIQA